MSAALDPQPGDRIIWNDPAPVWRGEPRMLHVVRVVDEPRSWDPQVIERHWYLANGCYVVRGYLDNIPATAEPCPLGSLPDDFTCRECGEWFNARYWLGGEEYQRARLCLTDKHWTDAAARVAAGESIVVGGTVFTIAPDRNSADNDCAGHGGALFRIRMPDETIRESRNLWNNGMVPPSWRERLPDNAAFLPTIASAS